MKVIKTISENYDLKGLKGRLLLVDPKTVSLTPPELYIRSRVNEEWVEHLKQLIEEGADLDPVIVAKVEGKNTLVSGNHRVSAYRKLGKQIKVLHIGEISLEAFFKLQRELNPEILPMDTEELKCYAEKLYNHLKDKYKKGELYEKIADAVGRSPETVRKWLASKEQEEKQAKIKKAWELREKGWKIKDIAKELGVDERTVYRYLEEHDKTAKPAKLTLLTPSGDPTPEGLRLWSEYVEQSDTEKEDLFNPEKFSEFLKKKGLEAQKVEKIGKVYFNGTPEQAFMMVVEQAIKQRIQNAVNNGLDERDIKLLISKGKTGIFQYMSSTAKAKLAGLLSDYIQEQIQKREERQKEEELIIETAKEILQNPEFIFSSWTNLGKEVLKRLEEKGNYLRHKYHEGHVSEILKKYSDALLGVYKSIPEITQEELESLIQDYDLEEFESLEQFRETVKTQVIQEGKRPAGVDVLATKVWNEYQSQKIKQQQQEKAPPSSPPPSEELEDSTEESSPSNETEENWDEILKPFAEAYDRVFGKGQENQGQQQEEQKPKLKRGRPPKEEEPPPKSPAEQYLRAVQEIEYWVLWILDKFGKEEAIKTLENLIKDLKTLSNEELWKAWNIAYGKALADGKIRSWRYWEK